MTWQRLIQTSTIHCAVLAVLQYLHSQASQQSDLKTTCPYCFSFSGFSLVIMVGVRSRGSSVRRRGFRERGTSTIQSNRNILCSSEHITLSHESLTNFPIAAHPTGASDTPSPSPSLSGNITSCFHLKRFNY